VYKVEVGIQLFVDKITHTGRIRGTDCGNLLFSYDGTVYDYLDQYSKAYNNLFLSLIKHYKCNDIEVISVTILKQTEKYIESVEKETES